MNEMAFLRDLAVVLTLAGVAALVCQWLKQPRVIGYILAGALITALSRYYPVLSDKASIRSLAELGIIFLMFSMGLDFNLRRLRAVGSAAFVVALVDVIFMLWLGFMIGHALGWSMLESLFLGAIICDSSTAILTKVLGETGRRKEPFAQLMLGATIIEDLLAVALIAVLSGLAMTGALQTGLVLGRMGALAVFLIMLVVGGLIALPRFLGFIGRMHNDELLLITVVSIAFGVALLAIRLRFSLALGAFIVGAVMSEARQRVRIEMLTDPLRDVFAAVFFVAIGMMVNAAMVFANIGVVLLLTMTVMVGKFLATSTGAFLMGNDRERSVQVGCGMAQINEFALIIAALGASTGVTRESLYPVAVSVSVLTTFLNPYLLRLAPDIYRLQEMMLPERWRNFLAGYTDWAGRFRAQRSDDAVRRAVHRSLIIILINLGWIAGIFIATAYLARRWPGLFMVVPEKFGGANVVFWFAAAVLVIPFLVATLRKLQALGMILAEIKFPLTESGGARYVIARSMTEIAVLVTGSLALGFFIIMLSSAILPPWPILLLLLLALLLLTTLLWKFNIRLYARAQTALRDVMAGAQEWFSLHPVGAMPYWFRDARLGTVRLTHQSRIVGQVIRDLNLRNATGATIIGIERGQHTIVNPDADETFHAGDRVMLLGTVSQIEKARDWLCEDAEFCASAPGAGT